MGNFFSAVEKMGRDSIQTPLQGFEKLGKGDVSGAFGKWKGMFGEAERDASGIANSVGIRGWVGDHPNESIGALVATIFGGWMAAGAYGGAAAGGAGAAASSAGGATAAGGAAAGTGAAAAGTGAGVAGTGAATGAGAYLVPAASGGVSSASAGTGASLLGAGTSSTAATFTPSMLTTQGAAAAAGTGSSTAAAAPSTSALISMGNAGVNASTATAGASQFTPAMLTTQGAAASGGTYGAASAPASTSALGTVPSSTSGSSSSVLSNAEDWNRFSQMLKSVKQNDQGQRQQLQNAPMAPAPRTGFNFDRKSFQNEALTKSYSDLYNSPSNRAQIKF